MADYLKLAQEAFESSSSFLDANYRSDWEYSLKAFRNEHASGSKYVDEAYKSRSRIFRPKTRSIIRKNEAAAAVALFSNTDVVNIQPGNTDDLMSVASAACMKEVMEYRLTKTIPAFQICMGGVQDAQTVGVVCSYQYWEYEERDGKKLKDQPCIELRPIENIRLDAGASWLDPVQTSPYFCDIIPMYVADVRSMMETEDPKTGKPKWKKLSDEVIAKARPETIDGVRKARLGKGQDPHQEENPVKEFDTVWVMRWFIKVDGKDMTFYTMGTEDLLTEPVPIEEVYFHGKRPYVIGYAVLETHKALKTGIPMLVKPLQQETNEVANQRLDNVKFVLNKRWLVARGRQVDVNSLVRNVPGGVTLTTDPNTDIKESNWPDVTSSAYVEQDRINADLDELAGNFSPSTKVANNAVNDTLGGSRLAAQGAGMMTDYLLKTIIETWWEPVLRQVVLLEQYYETDEVVLGICAQKARLFPRFGLSRITDDLLMQEVNLSVNVGMGSSNPEAKLQKFLMATNAAIQLRLQAPPGANVEEMTKEVYSHAGYRDGSRFFSNQQDPRLMKAMQMIQQLQGALKGKQMELQADAQIEAAKLQSNERIKGAEIQVNQFRIQGELRIKEADLAIKAQELELEKLKIQLDAQESDLNRQSQAEEKPFRMMELRASVEQAEAKLEGERQKLVGLAMKIASETEKAQAELGLIQNSAEKEKKVAQVSDGMSQHMKDVMGQVEEIKKGISDTANALRGDIDTLKMGMGAIAGVVSSTPKRSAKKFALIKGEDKKTKAVRVEYDDDTVDEIAVS